MHDRHDELYCMQGTSKEVRNVRTCVSFFFLMATPFMFIFFFFFPPESSRAVVSFVQGSCGCVGSDAIYCCEMVDTASGGGQASGRDDDGIRRPERMNASARFQYKPAELNWFSGSHGALVRFLSI